MNDYQIYNYYSKHLKKQYGEKVYKLTINLPISCPNRINSNGCSFCAEIGTGFESLSCELSVREQLITNMEYIKKRYKANKFIAYFQNYTNTYMSLEVFKKVVNEALINDIVEIDIATRPDCIREDYLIELKKIQDKSNVNVTIELGLQSVNYHTLLNINRGHTLAEYIDAVLRIQKYNFQICTHLILNLPWDKQLDIIESAKILSVLNTHQVKIHSLYIAKETAIARLYEQGEIQVISKEEYIDRVIMFLEYLNPEITIQRLASRAPKENTLFCNWNTSWWLIKEEIENKMTLNNTYQGIKFNYMNGAALTQGGF